MKNYQEKVLNENKEFTSFLTHEQDIQFQLNSERLEGKREGEAIGEKHGEKIIFIELIRSVQNSYFVEFISF